MGVATGVGRGLWWIWFWYFCNSYKWRSPLGLRCPLGNTISNSYEMHIRICLPPTFANLPEETKFICSKKLAGNEKRATHWRKTSRNFQRFFQYLFRLLYCVFLVPLNQSGVPKYPVLLEVKKMQLFNENYSIKIALRESRAIPYTCTPITFGALNWYANFAINSLYPYGKK